MFHTKVKADFYLSFYYFLRFCQNDSQRPPLFFTDPPKTGAPYRFYEYTSSWYS